MSHSHYFKNWPFSEAVDARVYSTLAISEGRAPILQIFHCSDGAWQFMAGPGADASAGSHAGSGAGNGGGSGVAAVKGNDAATLVCLGCLAESNPEILGFATLPVGWCAFRESTEIKWQLVEFDER